MTRRVCFPWQAKPSLFGFGWLSIIDNMQHVFELHFLQMCLHHFNHFLLSVHTPSFPCFYKRRRDITEILALGNGHSQDLLHAFYRKRLEAASLNFSVRKRGNMWYFRHVLFRLGVCRTRKCVGVQNSSFLRSLSVHQIMGKALTF